MEGIMVLIIIGITLSIDAFSVAAVIGMTNTNIKKIYLTSFIVGIFHFIMPLLGLLVSKILMKSVSINSNIVLGLVLLLISLQMLLEYINPSKKRISLEYLGIIMFAFGVSIDSFSVGLGIQALTNNIILASIIFTICSFSFTFLGLSLGRYINKHLKKYSYIIGTIILFVLGISFLCK